MATENMVKAEDILKAHYGCIKGKSQSRDAISFGLNLFENVINLTDDINNRTYKPSPSISFVVTKPVCREVFAADYRDKVVHYYIIERLEPLLEAIFSDRTFNCRKGKGQLYGVKCLADDIKECSCNYTKECWYLKCDMKSFFMSIPRKELAEKLDCFIVDNYKDENVEELRYLARATIMNDPTFSCQCLSPKWLRETVPEGKSLGTAKKGCGIPIGNLVSQWAANFWLNEFDWMLEQELGFKHHGRYVDDFYVISEDKSKLLACIQPIREYLKGIGITLHPKKIMLQNVNKGIKFTGLVVKMDRIYIGNRTVGNAVNLAMEINRRAGRYTLHDIENYVCSMNSYLGLMAHCNSYAIRRGLLSMLDLDFYKYVYTKGRFRSLRVKKKYRKDIVTVRKLADKSNIEKSLCAYGENT